MTLDNVDALRQGFLCCIDVGLRENQGALCVVNVNSCIFGLEFLDACADVLKIGDVLDFKSCGSTGLHVPCEAATCGQESLVALGANQDALQDVGVLLCGDAVTTFNLERLPRTAKGDSVASAISLANALEIGADVQRILSVCMQCLESRGEDEVGNASLNAFVGAIQEIHVQSATFLTDGLQTLNLYVLGSSLELFCAQAHGQTDGVVACEEGAVEYYGLCLVLQHLKVELCGTGIDVLSPGLCKGVGANGGRSHQKKSKMFHNVDYFRVFYRKTTIYFAK